VRISLAQPTHPECAALFDPLFVFDGKRVKINSFFAFVGVVTNKLLAQLEFVGDNTTKALFPLHIANVERGKILITFHPLKIINH
jgi:hypothetical protein